MGSWRTTALGVCTILAAVAAVGKSLFDGDPATNPDWGTTIGAITAGVGLIMARDNKVTSEQAGAK
jgi:hypothetical protein